MPGKDLVPLRPAPQPATVPGPPWPQEENRRESEAAAVTIGRWAKRNRHFTVPLAVPVVLWLAGVVLHHVRAAGVTALCGGILAACVWYFASHKWDREAERWYARLSAGLGAAWLWAAAWLGPAGGTAGVALAAVMAVGTGTWGFFWWRHKRPRGMRRQQRLIAQCDAWWQSHCGNWNLHGSHVIDAKLSGVTLQMRIQGLPGRHSVQHFRQVIHLIESAAEGHADIGLVRVEAVRGKPSQVDLFLKRENPLKGIVEYDMTIAPQSVHDPAPFGQTETGPWKMISLRQNRFTIGMTRWGKSNDLLVELANLSGCPDSREILIDLKGGRSARPVLKSGTAEYVITELDEARMYALMLTCEIKARAMYAYDGNEQLLATKSIPAVQTFIDETRGLTATEDGVGDPDSRRYIATGASQGSGVEVYYKVYTQHGSLESSVGTEQIRANLPLRVCYRVAEARHGAYVIPEYNRLDASRLEEKGTCYIKDGADANPEQIRAPLMEHEMFFRIAAQNAELLGPRPPLVLYCGEDMSPAGVTWQEWWDKRWLRLHPAFHADSPQYQAAAAAAGRQDEEPDDMFAALARLVRDGVVKADNATAETLAEALAAHGKSREPRAAAPPVPSPEPGAGDGRSAAARIAQDDADLMSRVPADFHPSPEMVRRLPAVLASQADKFADAMEAATAASPVTPRELMAASGFGSSWVHGRLAALAEIGQVTLISKGRYVPLPGADIRRGLAEIKKRNDRLNAEARQKISNAA